jgi:hypothetical protein
MELPPVALVHEAADELAEIGDGGFRVGHRNLSTKHQATNHKQIEISKDAMIEIVFARPQPARSGDSAVLSLLICCFGFVWSLVLAI